MSTDREFSRPGSGFSAGARRGPTSPEPALIDAGWDAEGGIPALLAEQRGSLADAEADAGYRWAAPLVADRAVLDLGCGVGHGSELLAEAGAESVVGVDADEASIEIAQRARGTIAKFVRAEPRGLPLADASFDVVLCLSLLERDPEPAELLERIVRLVKPGGVLAVSLPTEPVRDVIDGTVLHPARSADEWVALLAPRFQHVKRFRRRLSLAATVLEASEEAPEASPNGGPDAINWLGADPAEDRSVLVAASSEPLPKLAGGATLVGGRDLRAYRATVAAWEQRARRAEADGSAKHWELVASREAQRRLRKRLWDLEHRPLRKLFRVLRGRPAKLTEGPPLRPPERDTDDWV